MFKAFPSLKKNKFWGSGLWSKEYYIGTAEAVSSEISYDIILYHSTFFVNTIFLFLNKLKNIYKTKN